MLGKQQCIFLVVKPVHLHQHILVRPVHLQVLTITRETSHELKEQPSARDTCARTDVRPVPLLRVWVSKGLTQADS